MREAGDRGTLARGGGRSYGDADRNAGGTVLDLTGLNRTQALDRETGVVEVGVTTDALPRAVAPAGWSPLPDPGYTAAGDYMSDRAGAAYRATMVRTASSTT
ncbi:FAD-binding protein [Herbidospora yilanensis]|uniref:FAD-binding protein n=1 Tax=Herbidospora yilanensis TaxID=354426 RepID=UPI000A04F1A2|nr:FAD-binding protein [Herbidospora yilanensis]